MKSFKSLSALAILALALFVWSCGGGNTQGEDGHTHDEDGQEQVEGAADTEQQGKEYTSAYICPMHCEGSGSEEAGTCPVCGMDYVKNEEDDHEGHDHEGHNH